MRLYENRVYAEERYQTWVSLKVMFKLGAAMERKMEVARKA